MSLPNFPKNFWIICVGLLFFIMSFVIILPELNGYLTKLHPEGKNYLGLTIFLFSLSAAISRPFSGKLADHIGRKKVMIIGGIIGTVMCLAYPLLDNLTPLIAITFYFLFRFIHGFSAGFSPTGATALVTDILPPKNRSIGMGIWGTFISVGFGSGQLLASWITEMGGINALFVVASVLALISVIIMAQLEETLPSPEKFNSKHLSIRFNDVFEPPVMPSAIVMFLSTTSTGIVFVITPDISDNLGINKGWFFGFYVLSTILIRLFGSRISDIIGRRKTLIIGQSLMMISMTIVAFSTEVVMYSIGATVFGMATGITSPTVFSWTADLSHELRRGVGAGTMFIALEIGVMTGSLSTVWTYDNTPDTIMTTFLIGAGAAFLAICYLIWHLSYRESKT